MNKSSTGSRGWFQIGLGDVAILVAGSAYVFDVVRRSREQWVWEMPGRSQILDLMVLILGVGLGSILLGQMVRRLGNRDRAGWIWAVCWRLLAVVGLGWSVNEIAQILQGHGHSLEGGTSLITASALVGLINAATPPGRLSRFEPGWKSRLMVILTLLAWLVFVAFAHGMLIYLVLVLSDGIQYSTPRSPLVAWPDLFIRLNRAGLETLPGLVGCLGTAIWVEEDIRLAMSHPTDARKPRSWFGVLGRVATVALAISGAWFIWLWSLPRLSPRFAEGLAADVEPWTVLTVVLSFAGLAAGISAQGAAHLVVSNGSSELTRLPEPRFGPWPWRIITGLVGLTTLEITLATLNAVRGDSEKHWYTPIKMADWLAIFERLGQSLDLPGSVLIMVIIEPGLVLIPIVLVWVIYRIFRLFRSRTSDPTAPLDIIVRDRLALGRFLGWWVALTTLMLASLPIAGVAALVLTCWIMT